MKNKSEFSIWMKNNSNLSDSSIKHYADAIKSITNHMIREGVISTDIFALQNSELDRAIQRILQNQYFIELNSRGNKMYSNALKQYRRYSFCVDSIPDSVSNDIDDINNDLTLSQTEREVLAKARIGQGQFRDDLITKYNSRCIITGICLPTVLTASHVKPWAVSSNTERLSSENGLLLSATFDRLFDSGMISFEDDGRILLSRQFSPSDLSTLGLSPNLSFDLRVSSDLKHNLEYHRDVIFIN